MASGKLCDETLLGDQPEGRLIDRAVFTFTALRLEAFAGFFTSSPRFGRTKPFDERKRLISACVHASLSASGGRTTLPFAPIVGEDMAQIKGAWSCVEQHEKKK